MKTSLTAERLASMDSVMADPPHVHEGAPAGVWGTSTECYEFIARHLPEAGTTLETGLGISTVFLGMWSAGHTCVVSTQGQVDALEAYTRERHLAANVTFAVGNSDEVLPALDLPRLDLFLIDGGHGFPLPVVDWYYGSSTLNVGGIVVVDDVHLPAVRDYLIRYLQADPRWSEIGGDHKWRAFRKESELNLGEEWLDQAFLGRPHQSASTRVKSAVYRGFQKVRGARRPNA